MIAVSIRRSFERWQHVAEHDAGLAGAFGGPSDRLLMQIARQLNERGGGLRGMMMRLRLGDFDQRRNQHEHAAHQDHVARAVAQTLVVGEHDVAELGLHSVGRTNVRIGELGQLLIVERGEAREELGVSFRVATDHQAMDRAQADFQASGSELRREYRHRRLIAGVGQVVHRFSKCVGQDPFSCARRGSGTCAARSVYGAKVPPNCLIDATAVEWRGASRHPPLSARHRVNLVAWRPLTSVAIATQVARMDFRPSKLT